MDRSLYRGREAYRVRAWSDAFEALTEADRREPLGAEDLERLANAAFLIAREAEFERALERAHHAWREEGDGPRAARCAFWIGFRLLLRGESGPANGWLARGRRLLAGGGETAEVGYLLLPDAERALEAGEAERALATAREATAIGTRRGDRDLAAAARHVEGRALLDLGRIEEGLSLLDEAMVAVTAGELSPVMTGLVYCSVIASCQRVHELGRARDWTSALARWCGDQRQLVAFTATCLVHRAEILKLHGAWSEALAEARRAVERHAGGVGGPPGAARYQEAEVLRLRGELDAAEAAYREASRAGAEPQPGLALLWLARGRTSAAAAAIGRALEATTDPLERARLLPARIEVLLAAEDLEGASAAVAELEGIAGCFATRVLEAEVAAARGALVHAEGDPGAALVDLRRAWKAWRALEMPHAAARARERIGRACRALGDEEGGRVELEASAATYEELGAAPDLARIRSLLGCGEVESHGLTPRELEVLRLVAAGGSNRDIAGELSLSIKTIERHVSHILRKLDVPSRVAATAWAYENEVVRPAK